MNDNNSNNSKKAAKQKIFVNDNKKKELEGFEEVMDLINTNGVEVKISKKDAQIEDYEIYDFLEKEEGRLERLDRFFTVQMPIERKYSQTKALIKKESEEMHLIKDEIIEKISHPSSRLCDFLDNLISKTY